jgi:LPXTG-site transpeptidase (sortase) family protein
MWRRLAVFALATAFSCSSVPGPSHAGAKAPAGIAGPFAETWQAIGASTLGAPVTPPLDHEGRLIQYFAYGALIEAEDGSGGTERYQVGRALSDAMHDPVATVHGRRSGSSAATEAFAQRPDMEYRVSPGVAGGFERLGGFERFGQPISWPATVAGQQVQWFEYGRLVWNARSMGGTQALDGWELARTLGLPVAREVVPVVAELPVADRPEPITSAPAPSSGFSPARIAIPAIGVDASIEQIGIVNGIMQTPEDAWNVGWYQETSLAGGGGNAVFAAHRDWWSVGPVVFYDLNLVSAGDTITVVGFDGQEATYVVTEAYALPAGANFTPVISSNGANEITLITCTGTWDGSAYTDRLIVRGVLV